MNRDDLPDWMHSNFLSEVLHVTEIYRCPDCESYERRDYSVDDDFTEETRYTCYFYPKQTVTGISTEVLFADVVDDSFMELPICPVCDDEMDLFFYDEIYEGDDEIYEGDDDGYEGQDQS